MIVKGWWCGGARTFVLAQQYMQVLLGLGLENAKLIKWIMVEI